MGVFDRLADLFKSYLNDDASIFGPGRNRGGYDPYLNEAYEELDEFLNGGDGRFRDGESRRDQGDWSGETTGGGPQRGPPEELRPDYAELGVPFGAPAAECREAYKKLLKIHHPDRHANHQGNLKKATEKMTRINAAWDRIKTWQEKEGGNVKWKKS
jgi:hypothetical protein